MRKHSLNTRSINDNKGLKKSSEIENAVRRFKKREQEKVLPLLGKKGVGGDGGGLFAQPFKQAQAPVSFPKDSTGQAFVPQALFTEADLSRAVHDTSFRLRRMRRGEGRGR